LFKSFKLFQSFKPLVMNHELEVGGRMRKKILCLVLLSLFISLPAGYAQNKPLKKIIWGVTSLSASQWIPWIAKDAKIYEKYGLDTELVLLRGSGQSAQAIIGNSILAAPCTLTTVMGADLSGADLVTVAHTVPGVQSKLLVKPEIKRPQDLKGKKLAVSGFGSLGDFLERYILKKHGLEPGRDVIMLSIGNQPERIQALETGAVDAADLSFPVDVQATRKGFKVLWDAKKEVSYPSMSVVLRRKSIVDDRDTVMRMVKAHVEAIHFLKANKEASTKILGKYLKTNDRELLDGAYEIYRDDFISVPYPITQGLQPTYEYVALQRPDVWNHKAEEFMDLSFIAELDKSGFIARLSGSSR
jgi:ABC-type nitrate/sulfonate/bicarbonate transport system substrate-binding protein